MIYGEVLACRMPPSCAALLGDEETRTILRWVLCKTLPAAPVPDAGGDP